MKRPLVHILSLILMIAALGRTVAAQQTTVVPQRPRGAGQQPPRDPAKAAKQGAEQPQNLTANPPNRPNLNTQQQKNRRANVVIEHYLGGLQKNVGLDDEQTRKLSVRLGNYVRKQLTLADRRNTALDRLKELRDQNASDEEIQAQYNVVETTEAQQGNAKRQFYADVNPQLSVQQQANLKLYMDTTDQNVRQAIQKSRNN
jgi:hypothetical protein